MTTPATVRIFPDYGDTVLWFDGPVDYDVAKLTQALEQELRAWEEFYYQSLTPDFAWKSSELASRYAAEGNRLAQRLADELGEAYEVQFRPYGENAQTRRFRGGLASNPLAVAAFDALAAAAREDQHRIARALASAPTGTGTGWFATAPVSGSVFRPPQAGRESKDSTQ